MTNNDPTWDSDFYDWAKDEQESQPKVQSKSTPEQDAIMEKLREFIDEHSDKTPIPEEFLKAFEDEE